MAMIQIAHEVTQHGAQVTVVTRFVVTCAETLTDDGVLEGPTDLVEYCKRGNEQTIARQVRQWLDEYDERLE